MDDLFTAVVEAHVNQSDSRGRFDRTSWRDSAEGEARKWRAEAARVVGGV